MYKFRTSELMVFLSAIKEISPHMNKNPYHRVATGILRVATKRSKEKKCGLLEVSCGMPRNKERLILLLKKQFSEDMLKAFIENIESLKCYELPDENYIDIIEFCFNIIPRGGITRRNFEMEQFMSEVNTGKVIAILDALKEQDFIKYYDTQDDGNIFFKPMYFKEELMIDLSEVSYKEEHVDIKIIGRACRKIVGIAKSDQAISAACMMGNTANSEAVFGKWLFYTDDNDGGFMYIFTFPLNLPQDSIVSLLQKALVEYDKTRVLIDTFIHDISLADGESNIVIREDIIEELLNKNKGEADV